MRALVAFLLLTGCATQQYAWVHQDKPGHLFAADNGACLREAFAAIPDASPATEQAPAVVIGSQRPRGTVNAYLDGYSRSAAATEADRKAQARNDIQRGCLYALGWRLVPR